MFWFCGLEARGILAPQPGTEPPALEGSLNHWTTSEVLQVTTPAAPQTLNSDYLRAGRRMRGSREESHFIFPTLWLENWHHFVICIDLSVAEKKKSLYFLPTSKASKWDTCEKVLSDVWIGRKQVRENSSIVIGGGLLQNSKRFQKFPGSNPTLAPSCLLHRSTHSTMYIDSLLCARLGTRCWE